MNEITTASDDAHIEFREKIQEAVDKLELMPLAEAERGNCILAIGGSDDNWYSFADILNEIVKRIV